MKTIIDDLKINILKLLSNLIKIEEFENLIYNNQSIKKSYDSSELIQSFFEINLRSKDYYYKIEEFYLKYFDEKELKTNVLKLLISEFLTNPTYDNGIRINRLVLCNNDESFFLFTQVEYLFEDWIENYLDKFNRIDSHNHQNFLSILINIKNTLDSKNYNDSLLDRGLKINQLNGSVILN
jgi:hypothetical protein